MKAGTPSASCTTTYAEPGRHAISTHGTDEETPKNIKDYKISNLLLELFSHYDHTSCAETPNLFSCDPESQVL